MHIQFILPTIRPAKTGGMKVARNRVLYIQNLILLKICLVIPNTRKIVNPRGAHITPITMAAPILDTSKLHLAAN